MPVLSGFLFRVLLTAALAVGVLSSSLDFFVPELIPVALNPDRTALEGMHSETYMLLLMGAAASVALGVTLIAMYGLYTFRRWAPWLNLAMTCGPVLDRGNGPWRAVGLGNGAAHAVELPLGGCGVGVVRACLPRSVSGRGPLRRTHA